MPSMKNMIIGAASLAGLASAFPQAGPFGNGTAVGPYNNGTAPGGGSGGNSTGNAVDNSFFCPNLNGQVFITPSSVSFIVECNTNHFGTIINVDIDISINSTVSKRQAPAALPTNLGDCLDRCAEIGNCVGTAFNSVAQTCLFYADVGASFTDDAVSFGIVVGSTGPSDFPAGATVTLPVLATNVVTVYSCAPTVTDCPLNGAAVVTQVAVVSSTEYICPTATVMPAAPVACGCAYSVSTAAAYQSTVVAGSTILVPVTSTVVAVPQPTVTDYSSTICPPTAVPTGPAGVPTGPAGVPTGPAGAGITSPPTNQAYGTGIIPGGASPTLSVFTGAADQVKAGMGMGAVVAAAALLL